MFLQQLSIIHPMNFTHLMIKFLLVEDFDKPKDQNINKTSNVSKGNLFIYLSIVVIFLKS